MAVTLVSLGAFGLSARAGLAASGAKAVGAAAAPVGYERDEHLPGAALLMRAMRSRRLHIAGATGTTALPDMVVPDLAAADISVRPAQPFVLRGTPLGQARALQCLATAIYYETASEPGLGQVAVAEGILNRVPHPAFPASVCGEWWKDSGKPLR